MSVIERQETRVRASQPAGGSVGEELGRLADLRDRGVLSDAEFEEQKRKLLGT